MWVDVVVQYPDFHFWQISARGGLILIPEMYWGFPLKGAQALPNPNWMTSAATAPNVRLTLTLFSAISTVVLA